VTAPLAAIGLGDGLTQSGVDGPALRAFMRNWPGGGHRDGPPWAAAHRVHRHGLHFGIAEPAACPGLAGRAEPDPIGNNFSVNVIGCSVDQVLAASDHILIFGRPTWCDHDAGADPVILFGGAYSPLDAQALSTFHGGNE
jgi:hypothetical protein